MAKESPEEPRISADIAARQVDKPAAGDGSVLLYTCANAKYEDFIPLLVFSGLALDPRFVAEMGVEDAHRFQSEHGPAISLIEECFPNRFRWKTVAWRGADRRRYLPNVVRFITPPETKTEYVFIADVDFIMLNPTFIDQNLQLMEQRGLPYANFLRPGMRRLTGLHFTRWEALYPLPDLTGLDFSSCNDEEQLAVIVERKNVRIDGTHRGRISPGIHISPNRRIDKHEAKGRMIPGWSWAPFSQNYRKFAARSDVKELRPLLSSRVQEALQQLDQAIGED